MIALMLLWLLDATPNPDEAAAAAATAFGVVFFVIFGIVILAATAFQIYCGWRVAVKCGYEGALSLLLLVPIVNWVIIIIWVFNEWPIETELKRYRAAYAPPPIAPPTVPPSSTTLPAQS